jgi:hypothetical protein
MSLGEMIILVCIIAAFISFAGTLGWAAHIEHRPERRTAPSRRAGAGGPRLRHPFHHA